MEEIKFDIIEYLGKHDAGVFVLLSLLHDDKSYESIFYYKGEMLTLTVEDSLEKNLRTPIEEFDGYNNLMLSIVKKLVPYEEIVGRIDEFRLE